MPELPEVETIRLQLDQFLKGLTIVDIQILSPKNFLGKPADILGKKVLHAKRRAKISLIELEDNFCLAIHLKLTGQLIYRDKQEEISDKKICEKEGPFAVCELPNKFTRVIITFDNGGKLFFNDLRAFGWIKVLQTQEACTDLPELSKLGPEANDEKAFSLEYFKEMLSKTKKPIKLVILDQEKLAGVGNIYANEALFAAGIMPTRSANSLTEEETKKLREKIIEVLNESIKYKGTSDRDEAYRQLSGQKGEYQYHLKVYGKTGKPCPGCSGTIERIAVGGRGTFFCPSCQK
ncbi:MAG: bifunctional DNA-formamidopyrimidine glycosylase/DNA-(apurinic or apyrimidinic site) lyase [Patescibacteria group bacterium]|jgi:formamidopyrimidine-DNA glycosylase